MNPVSESLATNICFTRPRKNKSRDMQVEAVTFKVIQNISEVNGLNYNSPLQSTTAMPQRLKLMPLAKLMVLWHPKLLDRGGDTNIEALAQIVIVGTVVIVITIVVIMMDELRGGSWLLPLAEPLVRT